MDYATNNQHRQIANHLATSAGSESEGTPQAGSSLLKSALPEKPTAAVSLPTNAPAQASVAGPASVPTPRDPAPMSATGPPPASAKPALLVSAGKNRFRGRGGMPRAVRLWGGLVVYDGVPAQAHICWLC